MPPLMDLTGRVFTRLKVMNLHSRGMKKPAGVYWRCLCECGEETIVLSGNLRSGQIKSCGCLSRETFTTMLFKHGHAKNRTTEYQSWKNMRNRCLNPNHPRWPDYGGRGVAICDRWTSFEAFFRDMGPKPTRRHTIERIDNHGDYEPGNCVWVTLKVQARNKRNNNIVEYGGQALCLSEWAEKLGIGYHKIFKRLKRGWSVEKALTTP